VEGEGVALATEFDFKEGAKGESTHVLVSNSQDPKFQTSEHHAPLLIGGLRLERLVA
jgi:hypothetical protein